MLTDSVGVCVLAPLQLHLLPSHAYSISAIQGLHLNFFGLLFQPFLTGIVMHSDVLSLTVTSFPTPTSLTEKRKLCITVENESSIVQRN